MDMNPAKTRRVRQQVRILQFERLEDRNLLDGGAYNQLGVNYTWDKSDTTEWGEKVVLNLRLTAQPNQGVTVTVPIGTSNANEGQPSVTSLVFNSSNWDTFKTVEIVGQDDGTVDDGHKQYTITIGPLVAPGSPFNNLNPDDLDLRNLDDDLKAIDDLDSWTIEDSPEEIHVMANDSDLDPLGTHVYQVWGALNGTAAITAGGVTFTPAPNYHGDGVFFYAIHNSRGVSSSARVELEIFSQNDLPVPIDDDVTMDEDDWISIDARGNDTDVEDANIYLEIVSIGAVAHGEAEIGLYQRFITYVPEANWSGTEVFQYLLRDRDGGEAVGTVTVHVGAVNDKPNGNGAAHEIEEDSQAFGFIEADDGDDDFDQVLTYAIATPPSYGTVVLDTNTGEYTYTPDPDYDGDDSFTFTVTDDDTIGGDPPLTSDPATVVISIRLSMMLPSPWTT
jgi:hypothetical protein